MGAANEVAGTRPPVEDHLAIVDLFARYCMYLDREDVESWIALFTPEAVYEVYGHSFEGHDGLRKMMQGAPHGLHLGGPPVVELTGTDRARTTQNLYFVPVDDAPPRRTLYTDELHKTVDGWRIHRRRCQFITSDGLKDRP